MSNIITKNKSLISAFIGHFLDRYEIALFAYFSALIAPIFFPFRDPFIQILSAFGTFALGYIARPVGGIIFGYYGDKYGRKVVFTYSILFIALPVFIISCLPSYESIGIYAPITLITCRMIQGFCSGAEFAGAGIYVGEFITPNKKGLAASFVCAIGIFGAIVGALLGALASLPCMPEWSWRIAFFLGGIGVVVSYFLRRKMEETPIFKKVVYNNKLSESLWEVFKLYKRNLLAGFFIGGCGHIFLYLSVLYMNVIHIAKLNLPNYYIMTINVSILLVWFILAPIVGYIADRVGIRKLMGSSALIGFIFAKPLYIFLEQNLSLYGTVIFQILLSLIGVFFVAPLSSLFTTLFSAESRFKGVGLSVISGQALLGGSTPFIASFLTELTGDIKTPHYLLMTGTALGLIGILIMKQEYKFQGFSNST